MNEEILLDENLQENSSEVLENEEVSTSDVRDTENTDLFDSGDASLNEEDVSADLNEEQSDSDSSVSNSETERTFTQDELEQIVSALYEQERFDTSTNNSQIQLYDLDKRNLYTSDQYIGQTKFTFDITGLDPNETYIFSCDVSEDFALKDGYDSVWLIRLFKDGNLMTGGAGTSNFANCAGGTLSFSFTGVDTFRIRSNHTYYYGSTSNYMLYAESYGVPVEVIEGTIFSTPLAEYSVSEGLLVCILLLLLANFIHSIFKGSHWFSKL